MKEPEFTKSADKQSWMDTAVLSTIPCKVTIIDPRPFIEGLLNIWTALPVFKNDYTEHSLDFLAKLTIYGVINAVIARSRAWEHGYDVDFEIHITNIRGVMSSEMDAYLREEFRSEIDHPDYKKQSILLDSLIKEMIALLHKHMNPNRFTVHKLIHSRDARTFTLEEHADWRAIQYTKNEMAKIDSRHEDI